MARTWRIMYRFIIRLLVGAALVLAALRHQRTVLQRKLRGAQFAENQGLFEIDLDRWFPSVL